MTALPAVTIESTGLALQPGEQQIVGDYQISPPVIAASSEVCGPDGVAVFDALHGELRWQG